jgi:hypothetical protein
LSTYDAVIADTECPQYMQTFHSYDYSMSVLKEKLQVQAARQSPNKWEREAVEHLNQFTPAVLHQMSQYTPLLRDWEADVSVGRFRVSADITLADVTVSLMEYNARAGQFQSTAFTTLFG